MDLLFVFQLIGAAWREFIRFRYLALVVGVVVAFSLLVYGTVWQEKYAVQTTLYADRQNIIQPLLAGKAQVTHVEEQRQLVRDTIRSRKILDKVVAEGAEYFGEKLDEIQQAGRISQLRRSIDIKSLGRNYIGVSYSDVDPKRCFYVLTKLVDLFIEESSAAKRSESRQAFEFIKKQADQYKNQLRDAEQRLKEFNASNTDGTTARVQARVEKLNGRISDVELALEQENVRIQSLEEQVNQEDRYLSQQAKASRYQDRITSAIAELDDLKISGLTDIHPDVVSLVRHIESLREAALKGEVADEASNVVRNIENPVYDALRGRLAEATVERDSVEKRLSTLKNRLSGEFERAGRIAARNAELAELTRDYDVTRKLYEEFLGRKEKARLSMTLDIEGQGVSYKIQEPAKFPLSPTGLKFEHFVLFGVLLGIIAPLALVVAYVLLDPRIRFTRGLSELGIPILADIPKLQSNVLQYRSRMQLRSYLFLLSLCAGAYVGSAVLIKLLGLS